MSDVRINKDGSEIMAYDEAGIPIYIREGYLSVFPDYRALCHWHEDIEFIYILEGAMDYYINGQNVSLSKGDSIVINSGRLHYGYSSSLQECHFYCIILHPSLLTANPKLAAKYISAVTGSNKSDYILFHAGAPMAELLQTIYKLKTNPSPSYELEVIGLFHTLWNIIYNRSISESGNTEINIDTELSSQRKMVSFIYRNYANSLTLDDIAAAGNVCRSKCCQSFKKYVGQSPIDFLNTYRLECSQQLLMTTSLSITEVSTACGFNHLSYFSKQFQVKYGCTPREYRRKQSGC